MRKLSRQKQGFRHDPTNGIQGDCYRTAIACVLGVDRDSVPHSHDEMTGPENEAFIDAWLHPRGLRRIYIPVLGDDFKEVANAMYQRGGGLPYSGNYFGEFWRVDRKAAGIADNVWARDLRASGITEGRASGATTDDAAKVAGHASTKTTAAVYDRATLEAAERFADARVKKRGKK